MPHDTQEGFDIWSVYETDGILTSMPSSWEGTVREWRQSSSFWPEGHEYAGMDLASEVRARYGLEEGDRITLAQRQAVMAQRRGYDRNITGLNQYLIQESPSFQDYLEHANLVYDQFVEAGFDTLQRTGRRTGTTALGQLALVVGKHILDNSSDWGEDIFRIAPDGKSVELRDLGAFNFIYTNNFGGGRDLLDVLGIDLGDWEQVYSDDPSIGLGDWGHSTLRIREDSTFEKVFEGIVIGALTWGVGQALAPFINAALTTAVPALEGSAALTSAFTDYLTTGIQEQIELGEDDPNTLEDFINTAIDLANSGTWQNEEELINVLQQTPEDVVTQEEIDAAQAAMEDKLGATPQTQTLPDKTVVQEEIVSLEPEPSLFGDTELTTGELEQIDYDTTVTEDPEFIQRQEDITKDAMRQALDDAGYTYDDAYIDRVYDDYGLDSRSVSDAESLVVQDWQLNNYTVEQAAAIFDQFGYEYTNEELEQFAISDSSDARLGDQNVRDYINENTVTTKEFYRIFSEIFGRAPTTEERAEYFGDENRIYTTTSEIQDTLEADFNANVNTTVQVEEDGDPFFQPDVTYPETDGKVEVEDVGYEVTEPEVTFETDDGGGGGETSTVETTDEAVDQTTDEAVDQTTDEAVDQTTDEAVDQTTDEAVDQTTDEAVDDAIEDAISSTSDSDLTSTTDDQGGGLADEATGTEDRPFAVPNGGWIYIGEGRWVLPDWGLIDEGSIIDNGDGTYSVPSDVYEDDSVWLRTATDPTWDPNNPEVFDVGDTGDIVGSGDPYEPEDQTVEEEGVDIFVDVFPETGDGTTQTTDTTVDTDGDNVPDENDDLPDDPTESVDTDDDGIGDNSDTDDDNDGVPDDSDANSTDPNTDGTEDDGDSTGGDSEETPDPIVVDPGDGSGDQDGGEDDGTGPGTGPGDGTGEGDGGDGTPGVEPVTKPKGMLGQAAFTPYKGGAISPQLPGFVEVAYQPKDYMAELNRIIGENSMFKGLI
jgi:hypothetical protein